jgi:hypothetical protein
LKGQKKQLRGISEGFPHIMVAFVVKDLAGQS